jgi:hypothetical protein
MKKSNTLTNLDLTMLPPELQPGNLHFCQQQIYNSKARIRVAICGRRFGKSHLGMVEMLRASLESKQRVAWWVSAEETQALRISRKLQGPLMSLEPADQITTRSSRQLLNFKNGSIVEFLSAGSGDHLRGEGLDFLVLDEAADIPQEIWSTVLRPALIDKPGRALILGTPRRRCDWLHKLYQRGLDPKNHEDVRSFTFKTSDNKLILPEQIRFARELMTPEEARREFDAEFLDLRSQTFGDVRALATSEITKDPKPHEHFVTGIDLGRSGDYTVLLSLSVPRDPKAKPAMRGFERFTGRSWDGQIAFIRGYLKKFPGTAYLDATGMGGPVYERLQAVQPDLHPYVISAQNKPRLIRELQTSLMLKEMELAPEEMLLNELEAFEVTEGRRPGEQERYEAPRGEHDDTVIALALAWHAYITHHGRPHGVDDVVEAIEPRPLFGNGFF